MRAAVGLLIAHPRLTALLGAVSISFSGILYRLSETSPETAAFFRCLYALPILLLAAWFERREVGALPRRSMLLAAGAGVLFAVDLIFWHHAVDAVGAGLATVLGNLQVVIVGVGAWLLFGERPSTRALIALPLVLAGVVLISGVLTANSYGANPPLGAALGIVAAFAYAFYLMVIRQVGRRRAGEPVAISTMSTAAVSLVVGLGIGSIDLVPSWPAHLWLVLLGVSAQSAGYLFISLSLPRLPSVVTSIILLAQPVLAVLLAMVLIGETPSVGQFAGVVLLLGGIALATAPLRMRRPWKTGRTALAKVGPADQP
jgi:drug/metabolite transporter (DMT)-like permease